MSENTVFDQLRKANSQLDAMRIAVAKLGKVAGVDVFASSPSATPSHVVQDIERITAAIADI